MTAQGKQVGSASIGYSKLFSMKKFVFISIDFLNKIGSTSPPQNHPVSSEKTIPYGELMTMSSVLFPFFFD